MSKVDSLSWKHCIFSVLFQEIVVVVRSCKNGLTKMKELYMFGTCKSC